MIKKIIVAIFLIVGLLGTEKANADISLERIQAAAADENTIPAAKKGDALAQLNLSFMYLNGLGVPQDEKEAAKWLRQSAEQGYAEAEFYLSVFYVTGTSGFEKDTTKGVEWCLKAAEQGYVMAQVNLGYWYSEGRGVEKNYEQSYFWLDLAAEQNSDFSGMRDEVAQKLSPDVLLAAQKRAKEWKPKTTERPDK